MDEFYEGEQVVFKVENEYLIGVIVFSPSELNNTYVIREGGMNWYVRPENIWKPYDIMDGEREGYEA